MHCVQALWGPVAPQIFTTALAVSSQQQHACFSGATDGSIVSWHYDASSSDSHTCPPSKSLHPVALLQRHQHPVVALLAGLADNAGHAYLLSLDCEGWMCLWDVISWSCLDMQRVAPLPSGVQPHIITLPDPEQVCLVIPAAPQQQQQQQHHQHSGRQQQHGQHLPDPATAAAVHAPMMLVLQWRTLSLVAAPLVAALGVLVHTTSILPVTYSNTLATVNSQQHQQQQQEPRDQSDGVVAVLAIRTAPALAPAAADTVVLAVTSSGYMFAGSCAGNKLPQAWSHSAAVGGSAAPLTTSCIRTSTCSSSSGYGSSTAAHSQLHALLVQHNCWRLLVCSSFSSSTGMPKEWQLAAQQQQQYSFMSQPQYSCGSPFAVAQPQKSFDELVDDNIAVTAARGDVGVYAVGSGRNRVRFDRIRSSASHSSESSDSGRSYSSTESDEDGCSSSPHQPHADQQQQQQQHNISNPSWLSSTDTTSARPPQQGNSNGEGTAAAEGNSSPQVGATAVTTAAVNGVHRRRAAARGKQRLLGGLLVLQQLDSSLQPASSSSSSSTSSSGIPPTPSYSAVVVVWTAAGAQEVWGVPPVHQQQDRHLLQQQQRASSQLQPDHCHSQPGQPVLLQLVQLQPWLPAAVGGGQVTGSPAVQPVTVLTAQDQVQQNRYALMVQRHPQQQQGAMSQDWQLKMQQQLPQQSPGCHLHMCELLPHQHHHHHHHHRNNDHQRPQCCFMLHHSHGSLKTTWSRQHVHSWSSTHNCSVDHTASLHEQHQQHQQQAGAAVLDDVVGPHQEQQQQQGDNNPTAACALLSSSRKRPAVDSEGPAGSDSAQQALAPLACASESSGLPADGLSDEGHSLRCKHPRLECGRYPAHQHQPRQHSMLALQHRALLQDLQQQKVTHMLLLASDSSSALHIAVILQSGTLLFYDLATYCIPGAAWHPDCCRVGAAHVGPVSSTLQIQFKCPPQDLIAADTSAAASGGSGFRAPGISPDGGCMGPLESAASSAAVPGTPSSPSSFSSSSSFTPQQHSPPGCTQSQIKCAAGVGLSCSVRPMCGGVIPLLLTGGDDGSVRAWDCREQQLGKSWMTVHPHTAPVVSFVIPPASSRLPWSSCVLSVDAAGVVALSCLATGSTHITLHGWGLGPPAQLAWSTTRGVLAAGGWDSDGLWRVSVWDTYSGQLDRQLSGPPAHMIMAQLTQELTSSTRMHKREQQQKAAAATGALHEASSRLSSSVVSSGTPTAALQKADLVSSGSGGCNSAVFVSRMEVFDPSCMPGPLRVLQDNSSRPDVLLLNINIDLLLAELEGFTKQHQQQQQRSGRRRQQQQQQVGYRSDLADGSSSGPLSQPGSLDMAAHVSNSSSSGGAEQGGLSITSPPPTPAATAALQTSSSLGLSRASSAASQSQVLLSAITGAAAGSGSSGQVAQRPQRPRGAVAVAVQALCLLHRWGVDSYFDSQLLQVLLDLGWTSVAPLAAAAPAAAEIDHSQHTEVMLSPNSSSSSSSNICASPAGPESPVWPGGARLNSTTEQLVNTPLPQPPPPPQWLSKGLLCDPLNDSGFHRSSLLSCPCLSQEVLLSGTGALVIGMPQQSQQQQQQPSSKAAAEAGRDGGPVGVVLYASSTLLSSRLLSLVALSRWLLSIVATTQLTPTAAAGAAGALSEAAPRIVDMMRRAAPSGAASPAVTMPRAAAAKSHDTPQTPTSMSPAKQQQQIQHGGGVRPVLNDLPLVSSICCSGSSSSTSLLSEAAHLILAALVKPAPPGTYAVPAAGPSAAGYSTTTTSTLQQQQGVGIHSVQGNHSSAVFTSPGAAAAASCWPPAVLQLALLHHHQQQGVSSQRYLNLHNLQSWLPLLVLSATAATAAPAEVPPELLAAVSASLLDVLFGAAPAAASVTAAGVLCGVLKSGGWHWWRPYLGKPAYIIQRLSHLVDSLSGHGHHNDHIRTAAPLLQHSIPAVAAAAAAPATAGVNTYHHSTDGSSNITQACVIIAEQPAAVADPRVLLHHGHKPYQQQQQLQHHTEGGLFISSSVLHSTAHGSPAGSGSRSAGSSPVFGDPAAAAAASSANSSRHSHITGTPTAAAATAGHRQPQFVSSSRSPQHVQQQQQQHHGAMMPVSRSAVVVWLRAVVDVFAAVALVDPATVLNELSHQLADPSADVSSSLPLVMSGLARLCQDSPYRHVLLPHLGYTAALAVQALEPNRPALRSSMMQPVSRLVKELTSSYPQVSCHSGSLQLAVGSARPLGLKHKDAQGSPSALSGSNAGGVSNTGGIMHHCVYAGSDGGLMVPGEVVNAAAVAIFDMNGGSKRKVLLLPVLLPLQRQAHGNSEVDSTASLASIDTSGISPASAVQQQQQQQVPTMLPGGIASLWSTAEGVQPGVSSAQQQESWGGSSSSLRSSGGGGGGADVAGTTRTSSNELSSEPIQVDTGGAGCLPIHSAGTTNHPANLQIAPSGLRSMLAGNTMTRAEAAMVQHWFGGQQKHTAAALTAQPDIPITCNGTSSVQSSALPNSMSTLWGIWLCHERRSSYYPSAAAAGQPLMAADDVASGVAAVAFNPVGDAVAAFIESCQCLVVWKLQSSWTQKLSSLGSSKPSTHDPCAYIPLPPAAVLQQVHLSAGSTQTGVSQHSADSGHCSSQPRNLQHGQHCQQQQVNDDVSSHVMFGDWCSWQLTWMMPGLIDLMYQGRVCASVEVHL